MDLALLTDRELQELQEGAADLLRETSIEKVRRMPCCDSCEARRMAFLTREVIHD